MSIQSTVEQERLNAHYQLHKKWLKWGPYLSERQWGTVREDYSDNGDAWNYLTHDMARSKAYRWGEDGIAGISDDLQRICFAPAFWNGKDPIIKERLFGLTPGYGNHGEDVKELYYYLDNTPTHSYMKYLYKYPHVAFPYQELIDVNQRRSKLETEYEIADTGVFDDDHYFDIYVEYAKNDAEDICIRISILNRSKVAASLSVMPTLWFRNQWSYNLITDKPEITLIHESNQGGAARIDYPGMGTYHLYFQQAEEVLFTENDTNNERLYHASNKSQFVKDTINDAVINGDFSLFNGKINGTKCAPLYRISLEGGVSVEIRLRLSNVELENALGASFDQTFARRIGEADEFYAQVIQCKDPELSNIQRQAYAGLLWNKQFYYIDIPTWLNGDPGNPPPPEQRKQGRNSDWETLNNADIISMPDKWEYPWYASWDLPFHTVALAAIDINFAKEQLILLLREWYMNPYGQIPAYEWAFSDVNPPVQAWAALQIYKKEKTATGNGDKVFLERIFQKLLINFTWWVNRKDKFNNNVFEGGFLGMDNIGIFDRNNIPFNGSLEQADGTAWMGMYCLNMLEMALELAQDNKSYEDMATKFFEHFTYIAASINQIRKGYEGVWDEEDGFFYDVLRLPDQSFIPIKVRSLVGLTSLFAAHVIDKDLLEKLPSFYGRLKWFVRYRQKNDEYQVIEDFEENEKILLSLIPQYRLEKILKTLLDENEFLSPGGIRSLSKVHEKPYQIVIDGVAFGLNYQPGDSASSLFGGNSNWRGPVWMPFNFLLLQALETYHSYFEDKCTVELPTGSGKSTNLHLVADDLRTRLIQLFLPDENNNRRINGGNSLYNENKYFKDLILFYECFHGDTGRGLGASHQTGWTGLIAEIIRVNNK
jgi:hypothetical protein